MLSFHGKEEIKKFILMALKRNIIKADVINGFVYNRYGRLECVSTRGYIVGTCHLNKKRKQIKAHQVIWLAAGNDIKKGFILDHINRNKTDNRLCNLRLVDQKTNSQNRRSYLAEQNPSAKLNLNLVSRIRSEYIPRKNSYQKLALKYKVSASLIGKIIRRQLWG